MQIRIANRQDEKKIVELIEAIFSESNLKLDLTCADADLKNVEANYFGKDGAFLVAEHEQKIVGVAAANMIDENTCALRRIYVAKDFRRKGIAGEMLSIIISIAKRQDYKKLVVRDFLCHGDKAIDPSTRTGAERFFQSLRFEFSSLSSSQELGAFEFILT